MIKKIVLIFCIAFMHFSFTDAATLFVADTLNNTDAGGLKQGHWIILNADGRLQDCPADKKAEEGNYISNKKNGTWFQFFCNGKTKNELFYVNNQPNGYAKFYYSNGKLSEEGMWQQNHWSGVYKYYYDNGQLAYEFNYNPFGLREGPQKYYHQNGKLKIEGTWGSDGQELGLLKEYYDDGSLKSEKKYNSGGHLDTASVKFYAEKKEVAPVIEEVKPPVVEEPKVPASVGFIEDGQHKTYGANKKIATEGMYKNGKLVDGKRYEYDGDKVVKTTTIKDGKIVDVKTEK